MYSVGLYVRIIVPCFLLTTPKYMSSERVPAPNGMNPSITRCSLQGLLAGAHGGVGE